MPNGATTYKIEVWAERADEGCSAHAYGTPVITYLIAHPCRGMTRLIATTTVNGKRVGFSQITVAFLGGPPASYMYAVDFRKLVLADGTGSVNDLLREGYRLPAGPTAIPSTEAFTATGQDSVATIYDAWYLDVPTPDNDPPLMAMLQNIFLQF